MMEETDAAMDRLDILEARLSRLEEGAEVLAAAVLQASAAMRDVAGKLREMDAKASQLSITAGSNLTTEAKLFALEAVLVHMILPTLLAAPKEALEVVQTMRDGLRVGARPGSEYLKLVCEEHINDLADRMEHKLRNRRSKA